MYTIRKQKIMHYLNQKPVALAMYIIEKVVYNRKACKKKNLTWLFGAIKKSQFLGITDLHHLASLVVLRGEPCQALWDGFFIITPHTDYRFL